MAKKTLPGPPDEFLRLDIVAKELGYSRASVYRRIYAKELAAAPVRPGGQLRVLRSELERYKAARIAEGRVGFGGAA